MSALRCLYGTSPSTGFSGHVRKCDEVQTLYGGDRLGLALRRGAGQLTTTIRFHASAVLSIHKLSLLCGHRLVTLPLAKSNIKRVLIAVDHSGCDRVALGIVTDRVALGTQ